MNDFILSYGVSTSALWSTTSGLCVNPQESSLTHALGLAAAAGAAAAHAAVARARARHDGSAGGAGGRVAHLVHLLHAIGGMKRSSAGNPVQAAVDDVVSDPLSPVRQSRTGSEVAGHRGRRCPFWTDRKSTR